MTTEHHQEMDEEQGNQNQSCRKETPKKQETTSSTVTESPPGTPDTELHEMTIEMFYVDEDHLVEANNPIDEDQYYVESNKESSSSSSSWFASTASMIKTVFSGLLLLFCIVVVSAAIFQKQTTATGDYGLPSIVAYIVFWVLLLWLALMEGGLNCMVGLKPVEKSKYVDTHRHAYGCTNVAHKGENLERFIVGRQYLDLTVVFLTSFMVSSVEDATVLGLPKTVSEIFLGSGLAVILVTIVVGQLVAQINSAHYMLDFINNRVMLATTYVALTVEASGILHATYLLQIVASKLAGGSNDIIENKTRLQTASFWLRVAFSLSLLAFSFLFTFKALFDGETTMWESVPAYASVILFVFLIFLVGMMEGLQIAFMAVVHISDQDLKKHPTAHKNCEMMFGKHSGNNLQAFLVGRQILQTVIMFLIARILTLDPTPGNTIFGVSQGFQDFFNTGVLGALISTIVASLSWRVLASSFPMAFLSNPFSRPIIDICLYMEHTGICNVAWSMAKVHRKVAGLKRDETHLGVNIVTNPTAHKEDLNLTEQGSSDGSEQAGVHQV